MAAWQVVSYSVSGAQLLSYVAVPSQGPQSLFWLAEGERDSEGVGITISYCLALNCSHSIGSSYSHSPVVTSSDHGHHGHTWMQRTLGNVVFVQGVAS